MLQLKDRVITLKRAHYIAILLLSFLSTMVWARGDSSPQSQLTKNNTANTATPAVLYQVEVLVFQRLENLNLGNESPDTSLIPLRLSNTVELDDPLQISRSNSSSSNNSSITTLLPTYTSLPSSLFKLNPIEQKLNTAPGYRVLFHDAWYQAQNTDGTPVHLYASPLPHDKMAGAFNTNPLQSPYFSEVPFEINGTVAIKQRGNYIADLHLIYTQDNSILAGLYPHLYTQLTQPDDRICQFVMRANRKIRNGEIHYFDNPLFGVLVTINEPRR